MKCWHCNTELIWGGDHELEEDEEYNIVTKLSSDGLSGEVTSRADYSQFLEFGTSKMGARPFMQPSLEENRPKIRARVRRLLG